MVADPQYWWRVNGGQWNGSGTADPASGTEGITLTGFGGLTLYPTLLTGSGNSVDDTLTANFGATAFTDTVPAGFVAGWPAGARTALNPADAFNAALSNGNLTITGATVEASGTQAAARVVDGRAFGKYYFEVFANLIRQPTQTDSGIGLFPSTQTLGVLLNSNLVFFGSGRNTGSTIEIAVQFFETPPTPTIDHNLPVRTTYGREVRIFENKLSGSGWERAAADLVFGISMPPLHGAVLNRGTTTSSFTQADINNGLVSYLENGDTVAADSFVFGATDGGSNAVTGTFDIIVMASLTNLPKGETGQSDVFCAPAASDTATAPGDPPSFVSPGVRASC